jgi:hypothetical protein
MNSLTISTERHALASHLRSDQSVNCTQWGRFASLTFRNVPLNYHPGTLVDSPWGSNDAVLLFSTNTSKKAGGDSGVIGEIDVYCKECVKGHRSCLTAPVVVSPAQPPSTESWHSRSVSRCCDPDQNLINSPGIPHGAQHWRQR